MPKGRKVFHRKKRRRPARRIKRRGGKSATTAVMRGPSGFPDRIRVKLNYYGIEQYTLTTGAANYGYYRGNSLYAPRSSGGHQPYAYDQWTQFYSKYRVLGSAIRVVPSFGGTNFTGSSSTNDLGLVVVPKLETTSPTSEVIEQPYSKSRTASHYASNCMIKHYMSTSKIYGTDHRAVRSEDDFAAYSSSSPVNLWYWFIYVFPPTGTSDTMYVSANIKLTFYVEFSARVTENQS